MHVTKKPVSHHDFLGSQLVAKLRRTCIGDDPFNSFFEPGLYSYFFLIYVKHPLYFFTGEPLEERFHLVAAGKGMNMILFISPLDSTVGNHVQFSARIDSVLREFQNFRRDVNGQYSYV